MVLKTYQKRRRFCHTGPLTANSAQWNSVEQLVSLSAASNPVFPSTTPFPSRRGARPSNDISAPKDIQKLKISPSSYSKSPKRPMKRRKSMLTVNRFLTPITTPFVTHLVDDDIQDDEIEESVELMQSKAKKEVYSPGNTGSLFKKKQAPKLEFTNEISGGTDKHRGSFGSFLSMDQEHFLAASSQSDNAQAKRFDLPMTVCSPIDRVPGATLLVDVQLPETEFLLPIDMLKRPESETHCLAQLQVTPNDGKVQDSKQNHSPVEPKTPEIHVLGFNDLGAPLKRRTFKKSSKVAVSFDLLFENLMFQ